MRSAKTYLLCAVGAVLLCFLAPNIWQYVAINAIGPRWQQAVLAGIGAILGGVIAERVGWKGR